MAPARCGVHINKYVVICVRNLGDTFAEFEHLCLHAQIRHRRICGNEVKILPDIENYIRSRSLPLEYVRHGFHVRDPGVRSGKKRKICFLTVHVDHKNFFVPLGKLPCGIKAARGFSHAALFIDKCYNFCHFYIAPYHILINIK